MLATTNLACERGCRQLFSGLELQLDAGQLLLLTGANGAGKTSLLRILAGLLLPAHGVVSWRGHDIRALGEHFASEVIYVGHATAAKDELTARENLLFASRIGGEPIGTDEAEVALRRFGLAACADLPSRVLSQGQRRRISLARLSVTRRPLWLLDEPLTGLDRDATEKLEFLLLAQLARGGIVVVATHQGLRLPPDARRALHLGEAAHDARMESYA
jgi:heme exporter protein A